MLRALRLAEDKMLDVVKETPATGTVDTLPIPPLAVETPCCVSGCRASAALP